jgi:hypothetical protein
MGVFGDDHVKTAIVHHRHMKRVCRVEAGLEMAAGVNIPPLKAGGVLWSFRPSSL